MGSGHETLSEIGNNKHDTIMYLCDVLDVNSLVSCSWTGRRDHQILQPGVEQAGADALRPGVVCADNGLQQAIDAVALGA